MDQATVSSWKLLPWPILGASNKKPRGDRSSKKVSALRRRLQAHAAIARSLSPFCARASFNSPAIPEEESKCLLSLSAFMSACGHCAFRDVQVPLASVHSPHQQKAYIKEIHHHLQEPSLQHHTKIPSTRRAPHHKAAPFGNAVHTEKSHTSREGFTSHQRDHSHRHMTPPKKGDLKRMEVYERSEIEIKPTTQGKPRQLKQYIEGEGGESRFKKHGKCHHKLEVYSFDTSDRNAIAHAHHCTPATSSSSSRKGIHKHGVPSPYGEDDNNPIEFASHGTKARSASSKKPVSQSENPHRKALPAHPTRKAAQLSHNLEADLYVCTTTHVLEKHKGKVKAFKEGMHEYSCKNPSLKDMHRYADDDPIVKSAHHNHVGTEAPLKSKHSVITKGLAETFRQASENAQSLKELKLHKSDALKERAHQHTDKDPSLSYLLLKDYHESKQLRTSTDAFSLKCSELSANKDPSAFKGSEFYANKDPLALKGSESYANKDPLALNSNEFYENKDPLSLKSSEHYVSKDPLSVKSTESFVKKGPFSKLTPSPVYKGCHGDNNVAKAGEKIQLMRLDHDKVSGGIWMQDTIPVVKFSHNPYRDFHSSMLEMLLERGLKDLHELQDMFVCYVLLNSPRNQKHIERAFRDLLTDLYKCKLMKSLQVEEMPAHAKTEGLG